MIFSGGIGENCPLIRSRICHGLEFLGIDLEEKLNMSNDAIISKDNGRAVVRVIHTDEELMIAKTVYKLAYLIYQLKKENPNIRRNITFNQN